MKKTFKKVAPLLSALALFFPAMALAGFFDPMVIIPLGLPMGGSESIMENVMRWILGIVGFLAIIGFCIAGILYFVAAGDEDASKRAKRAMLYSIIGVVVSLMGYVVWIAAIAILKGRSNF